MTLHHQNCSYYSHFGSCSHFREVPIAVFKLLIHGWRTSWSCPLTVQGMPNWAANAYYTSWRPTGRLEVHLNVSVGTVRVFIMPSWNRKSASFTWQSGIIYTFKFQGIYKATWDKRIVLLWVISPYWYGVYIVLDIWHAEVDGNPGQWYQSGTSFSSLCRLTSPSSWRLWSTRGYPRPYGLSPCR